MLQGPLSGRDRMPCRLLRYHLCDVIKLFARVWVTGNLSLLLGQIFTDVSEELTALSSES
jgi:hypothetical protein